MVPALAQLVYEYAVIENNGARRVEVCVADAMLWVREVAAAAAAAAA